MASQHGLYGSVAALCCCAINNIRSSLEVQDHKQAVMGSMHGADDITERHACYSVTDLQKPCLLIRPEDRDVGAWWQRLQITVPAHAVEQSVGHVMYHENHCMPTSACIPDSCAA